MKKILVLLLSAMLFFCFAFTVLANNENYVYVSISNGELELAHEKINLSDADNDGKLTINDALYLAHEAKYEGGAKEGYVSSMGAYGLKIDKLWGVDGGDAFGYYLNNGSAMSLGDTVKNGDYVYAFSYTDLEGWSDTYSYFDIQTAEKSVGEFLTLTLSSSGYDASWNLVSSPVCNAYLLIDGVKTEIKTDEHGKASINFNKSGTYVLSAVSETQNLVPAVCVVTVFEKSEVPAKPGDTSIFVSVTFMVIAWISLYIISRKRRCV